MMRSSFGAINDCLKLKADFVAHILNFERIRLSPTRLMTKLYNVRKSSISLARIILNRQGGSTLLKGTGCLLGISFLQLQSHASKVACASSSASEGLPRLLADSDRLHTSGSEAEAYRRLRAALESGDPVYLCAEVFWRVARGARAMANACGDTQADERKAHTYEAFHMAQRALALEPDNSACHKWMGILLELTGRYEGTKKRIENSYLVRDHFQRAVDAKPKDAVVLHCLGVWCFEVTDLPWYQRKLAAAFFATPPSSNYEEALGYLLRAEAADPNFYSCNLLYIGKAYLRLGDKSNARAFLQRTVEYQGDTFDDRQSRDEAGQLLKNL